MDLAPEEPRQTEFDRAIVRHHASAEDNKPKQVGNMTGMSQ